MSATTGGGDPSATTSVETVGDAGGGADGRTQDGLIIVDGIEYAFSLSPPGRCGVVAQNGSIFAQGFLIDEPNRQVSVLYALGADTDDGEDLFQIVIMNSGGTEDFGNITSLDRDGATVTAAGTLTTPVSSGSGEFTEEFACDERRPSKRPRSGEFDLPR